MRANNRRALVWTLALFGLALAALVLSDPAQATPDPVTCEGYPEHRVYLENQSWLTPQPGNPAHPGYGQQGHIHVGTCFPLHQTVTQDIEFDIRVQLHNIPGTSPKMRLYAYQMGPPGGVTITPGPIPSCPTADCETWVHVTFPINSMSTSGWGTLLIGVWVDANGVEWYNLPRWFVNFQNGKPVRPNNPVFPPAPGPQIWIGGDTWLPDGFGGLGNYSAASIDNADFPWNFTTGQLIPVSGVWQPHVKFGQSSNMWATTVGKALIDPALHAHPTNLGTIVYDGVGGPRQLSIDTTQLSNGVHRLLLSACSTAGSAFSEHCGVLVVQFLVNNPVPTTTTSTTTTTTTTIPPTVIDLAPGEALIVNCPTTLTGTVGATQAELACA